VFVIMGYFWGTKIDSLFLTALLTVLGFSVHDTIVVFDRIRERLKIGEEKTFEDVVNTSVNQTMIRSIATSMTVIFVLLTLLLFGGESIRTFVVALLAGMFVGTYSSIFIASPLLVTWYKFRTK
jgi:preprotein translocase subunit SecF